MTRRPLVAALLPLLVAAAPPGAESDYPAADAILAAPAAVDPFGYAKLVTDLWEEGRREQAAFWFYVFQIRTRPWAEADRKGDGAAALRAALNATMGETINGWIGGDLAVWRDVAFRAIGYEARLPLYPGCPDGIDATAWTALVQRTRASYAADGHAMLGAMQPADLAARRRAAGLPTGPLEQRGPRLPEAWR